MLLLVLGIVIVVVVEEVSMSSLLLSFTPDLTDCIFTFQSSLVDASEDSQMEAAIQASLQQLEEEQGTTTANSTSESELGDDDLETFSDSDSETHPSPKKSLKKCENNHTVPDGARKKLTIDEDDDDDGDDENDDENDNDEEEKNEENGKEMDENINEEEKREDEKASTSSEMENTNQINKDKWKEFLGDENGMLSLCSHKKDLLSGQCLSQQGVWVSFGRPNPQKSPFRTLKIFCRGFLKISISSIYFNFFLPQ